VTEGESEVEVEVSVSKESRDACSVFMTIKKLEQVRLLHNIVGIQ